MIVGAIIAFVVVFEEVADGYIDDFDGFVEWKSPVEDVSMIRWYW